MSGIADSERSATAAEVEKTVSSIVEQLHTQPGALLPILHAVQDQLGYVPASAVPIIADGLRQTSAEIHGVISFYHQFRSSPPGRNQLQICRAEACQARGARELEKHVQEKLGIGYHQTTADKEFSLDAVYCLGNCACGPSVRIGDEIVGRVDPARFDQLVDELTTLPLEVK